MRRPLYRHPGMPLQRWLAHPHRPAGDTIDGIPGDCQRTAMAGALGLERDDVPHFVGMPENRGVWFWEMQRWLFETHHAVVYTCAPDAWLERENHGLNDPNPAGLPWVVVSGPSPRGAFHHACVADRQLNIVHDPHPLGVGLTTITTVDRFDLSGQWTPPPRLALPAAKRPPAAGVHTPREVASTARR